ncbi:MAG TPA: sigma-70 family RNA polymerase sigma factor, partial [Planctomycetota bacterium]|nr:sigma-70 family RNA polymerase sigma factor [Planctomycetota bacterium]
MAATSDVIWLSGGGGPKETPAGSELPGDRPGRPEAGGLGGSESQNSSRSPSAVGGPASGSIGSSLGKDVHAPFEKPGPAVQGERSDTRASQDGGSSSRGGVGAPRRPTRPRSLPPRFLAALLNSDGDVWRAFVTELQEFVRRACRRALFRRGGLRGDILDESEAGVWRRLWRNRGRLERYAARPGFLLKRLAENSVRAALRRKRRLARLDVDLADPRRLADPAWACLLRDELERLGRALRSALVALPERERRVLEGRFTSGMTLAEIAKSERCSKPRVCAIVARAATRFLAIFSAMASDVPRTEDVKERRSRLRALFSILSREDQRAQADGDGRTR